MENLDTSMENIYHYSWETIPAFVSKRLTEQKHGLCKSCTNRCWKVLGLWCSDGYWLGVLVRTRMWANAQRDGRPAEHRWRPLFNATKFGWRSLLDCRAVTLPRLETRWNLQGCPKLPDRSQPLVGRKFTILWGHVEEILLLHKFFLIVLN